MFSIMRTLKTAIITCFLLVFVAGSTSAEELRRKIIAAVPADFPPTYFKDKQTGKAAGFAIDVMNEVARQAGLEVEYIFGQPWDEISQILLSGKADVIPNLVISEDRKKLFTFTHPVESVPINYLVRSNDKQRTALKPGMTVGVIKGSIPYNFLKSRTDITLVAYENLQHLLFDLLAGHLDMVLTPTPNILKLAIEAGVDDRVTALEPPVIDAKRGMALRPDDRELYQRLDRVIAEFVGSDTYIELYEKWWGKPKPYWTVKRVVTIAAGILIVIGTLMGWLFWASTSRLNRRLRRSLAETEEERFKLDTAAGFLQKSEERFRELFESIADPIYISDLQGKIVIANEQACQVLGYSSAELLQMNLNEVDGTDTAIEDFITHLPILEAEGPVTFEATHRRKDGSVFPVEINVRHITFNDQPAVMGVARDITERKKAEGERRALEEQLLHAQKLESLGVLAGGIAHDFNNILTAIIGNADLALMRLTPESPAQDNLLRIEQAAVRAADLARQMLAYSGKGQFVIEPIDLNRLVEEMGHLLEVSISKKAILRYNLIKPLPTVDADATQLRQIVMNLVINASEAISDQSGVIVVTTGSMECTETYLRNTWSTDNIQEGRYVSLEIADNGCGMDKETMGKIFDPFFSTKFAGRGLGMAAVMGIIRGHKGAIKVYSEPGKGTTFKVLLPAGEQSARLARNENGGDSWRGSGTVLLVDDEETILDIGREMLQELGFDVLTACDGREALEVYLSHRKEISVVVLDLTMPHIDGEQCFRELRQIDPAVQVIMSSGFSESEVTQKFVGKGLAGFVQKPYRLAELSKALREIIL